MRIKRFNEIEIDSDIHQPEEFSHINESIISDIKKYAKKGILTTAILTSLLSNTTFSQEQKLDITNSVKTEIVEKGPLQTFLDKYSSDDYHISKGSSKYDLEVANKIAIMDGQKNGYLDNRKVEDEKAFQVDGEIIYIIIYKK